MISNDVKDLETKLNIDMLEQMNVSGPDENISFEQELKQNTDLNDEEYSRILKQLKLGKQDGLIED